VNQYIPAIITIVILLPFAFWFCAWIQKKDYEENKAKDFDGWCVLPCGDVKHVFFTEHWEYQQNDKVLRKCAGGYDNDSKKMLNGPVVETADEAAQEMKERPVYKLSNYVFRDEHEATVFALSRTLDAKRELMKKIEDAHDREMKLIAELEKQKS